MDNTVFISCSNCSAQLRVPVDKGTIRVVCPCCGNQFLYYGIKPAQPEVIREAPKTSPAPVKPKEKKKKKKTIILAILAVLICFTVIKEKLYCSHDWAPATCSSPSICRKCGKTTGTPLAHKWLSATCTEPRRCSLCGETTGSPDGHDWLNATCTSPKTCAVCGATSGSAKGHSWSASSGNKPQVCKVCGYWRPMEKPNNGQVFIGSGTYRPSELTINCLLTGSDSYYIKLKNQKGQSVFSFFVQAGKTATVSVPAGYYQVFFASGADWYGTEYLFGENTYYSKDAQFLDFGNYTYTYTLYPVLDGNFKETPIDPEEF